MPGRALLHGFYHAPVHHQRGQIPLAALPDEIRTKQVKAARDTQNHFRVVAIGGNESATQSHVLEGTSIAHDVAHCNKRPAIISGSRLRSDRRRVSNSRSTLQVHRFHHMLLHTADGHVTDLRVDRPSSGRTTTEFGHPRLVERMVGRTNNFR